MQIFACSACQQTLFFENVQCVRCSRLLAFLPDRRVLSALEPKNEQGQPATFVALAPEAAGSTYRFCKNRIEHAVCNWAIPADDPQELCVACRLNGVVPNVSQPKALEAWRSIENAKRYVLHTLMELALPFEARTDRSAGLEFRFLKGSEEHPVFTGHVDGIITLNIAEADAPFREKIRAELGEQYRTLIGHFRHEIGHYYWDRFVKDSASLPAFRTLFGNEELDYQAALKRHYEQGPPPDWHNRFVSTYASMHPWEDWAETWAHYLHMIDTLGTARSCGLVLKPEPVGGSPAATVAAHHVDFDDFDDLMNAWIPATIALNSLNRSMGLPDPYPFVLSAPAIIKLRFVHDVIELWDAQSRRVRAANSDTNVLAPGAAL